MAENDKLVLEIEGRGSEKVTALSDALKILNDKLEDFKGENSDKLGTIAKAVKSLFATKVDKELHGNLTELSNSLISLGAALDSVDGDNLEKFANAIVNLNKLKISAPLTQKLSGLSQALKSFKGDYANNIDKASEVLSKLGAQKIPAAVAKQITAVTEAIQKLPEDYDPAPLGSLLEQMSKLDKVKINKDLGQALLNITDALNQMSEVQPVNQHLITNLQKLAEGLNGFKELQFVQFGGVASLVKTVGQLGNMSKVNVKTLQYNLEAIAEAVKRLADETAHIDDKRLRALASAAKAVAPPMEKADKATKGLASSMKLLKVDVLLRWGRTALRSIGRVVGASATMYQSMDFFNRIMGESAQEAYKFAQDVERTLGIPAQNFMQLQGNVNMLIRGFGIASDKAKIMSQNMVQLAYDFSVMRKESPEQILNKLRGGLAGSAMSVRNLGMEISNARLQQELLNSGYDIHINKVSQATKAMLRYNVMLQDSVVVQQEFSRSLQNPAMQLEIMRQQIRMLGVDLGNLFIPLINNIVPPLIAAIRVIREFAAAVASILGFEFPQMDAADYSGMVEYSDEYLQNLEGATGEIKKQKKYLARFDTLNVMNLPQEPAGLGGIDLDLDLRSYDFLAGAIADRINEWYERLSWVKNILDPVVDSVQWIHDKFGDIGVAVAAVGAGIGLWALSSVFLGQLGKLGGLLAIAGSVSVVWSVYHTLKEGMDMETFILGAVGGMVTGAIIGSKYLTTYTGSLKAGMFMGAAIGLGIAISLIGFADIKHNRGFSIQNMAAVAIGGAVAGAALLSKYTGTLPTGALLGALVTVGIGVSLAGMEKAYGVDASFTDIIVGAVMSGIGAGLAAGGVVATMSKSMIKGGKIGLVVGAVVTIGMTLDAHLVNEDAPKAWWQKIADKWATSWNEIKSDFFTFSEEDTWVDVGANITKGIFVGIFNLIDNLIYSFFTFIVDGIKSIFGINSPATEMYPIGESIAEGILYGITKPFRTIGTWIDTNILIPIKNAFTFDLSRFSIAGSNIGNNIRTGMANTRISIENTASNIVSGIRSVFTIGEPTFTERGNIIGLNIRNGLSSARTSINNTALNVLNGVKGVFIKKETETEMKTVGGNLINALRLGIEEQRERVNRTTATVAAGIVQVARTEFSIHSPSRVFMYFGEMIGLGLERGIERSMPDNTIFNEFTNELDKIKDVWYNTVDELGEPITIRFDDKFEMPDLARLGLKQDVSAAYDVRHDYESDTEELVQAIFDTSMVNSSLLQKFMKMVADKDLTVELDGREISRSTEKHISTRAMMAGVM